MKQNKSPAFQFYPSDFLSDENVVLMTPWQRGIYITLLCHCWREGSIPSDRSATARLGGFDFHFHDEFDANEFGKEMDFILSCFEPHPEKTSRLVHPRLEKERLRQQERRDQALEAAEKSVLSRKKAREKVPLNERSTDVKREDESPAQRTLNTSFASSSSFASSRIKSLAHETKKQVLHPQAAALTDHLVEQIVKAHPHSKLAKSEIAQDTCRVQWISTIRMLLESDGRTDSEIREVIQWALHDNFWSANIMSAEKLRKNFDTLVAHKNRGTNGKQNKNSNFESRMSGVNEWLAEVGGSDDRNESGEGHSGFDGALSSDGDFKTAGYGHV